MEKPNETLQKDECRICGAPAKYLYCNVLTCQSCKMFFKRNAQRGETLFKCQFDNQCIIHFDNRNVCKACRLKKSFQCGMTTDKFRPSRPRKSKIDTLVKTHMTHQPKRLSTLNLLESDKSLLTSSQWTLLSNILNCYNEYKMLFYGQRLVNECNNSQIPNTVNPMFIQEYLSSIYDTAGVYLRSNNDICQLPFNDRTILLSNAANNIVSTGAAFAADHFHLLSIQAIFNAMLTIYDKRTVDIHLWAMKFIDPDIVLIKLAISMFALSETTFSYSPTISIELTNPLLILEVQNKYAEITWKYLLYKYGHSEAVKRFLNLVLWFDALILFMSHGQSVTTHVNDMNSLIEQTEMNLILDDVDQII